VYKEQINDSPAGRKIVINLKLHSVAVKDFSKQTSEQFIVTNENARGGGAFHYNQ
jgi:hypothetical protein